MASFWGPNGILQLSCGAKFYNSPVELSMKFSVIKSSCVREFHDHLDGISFFIKFTYKLEMDGRLPFLYVLATHQHNGTLTTTIYHKPTHKSLLTIHFHYPRHHKLVEANSNTQPISKKMFLWSA